MEIFNYFLLLALRESYQITLYTSVGTTFPQDINVRVHSTKLLGVSGFRAGLLWFMIKVAQDIMTSRNKPDFLHVAFTSDSGYYGVVLPFIASRLRIPYLVSIHGGGLKPWRPVWMYKRLFSQAKEIVAVSDVIQKEYEIRTHRKVTLILPLIPFSLVSESKKEIRERLGFSNEVTVILFLGSIKEIKRPLDIVKALILLGKGFLQIHKILMLFVGEGDQRAVLEGMTTESGLGDHLQIVGKVPYDETAQYYVMSDIYIIPSKYEGTSKSMLGAMYYGLPIIGSNVPGINNVLVNGDSGLLFEFGDADKLSTAIRLLVEDKLLRTKLAEKAARIYASDYSFEMTVRDFTTKYTGMRNSLENKV